ncbi:MAG: hypothetical protein AAB546_00610 [Patescibacteria group bacterium]
MAKKLEHKNKEPENESLNTNGVVDLMHLLAGVKINNDEAELNKVSMKDNLGRRILF